MSTRLRATLLLGAVAGTLALGGCRGAAQAPGAAPVTAAPAPATAGPVTVSPPTSASGADSLGSVESSLDAIERQLDRDGTG